jgi:hypothetical protein
MIMEAAEMNVNILTYSPYDAARTRWLAVAMLVFAGCSGPAARPHELNSTMGMCMGGSCRDVSADSSASTRIATLFAERID